MAGIASLAKSSGHKVTGCDKNVYPPMSTQLKNQDIAIKDDKIVEIGKINSGPGGVAFI